MNTEPTRADVLGWLASTGRSQSEAVTAFWGPLGDDDRRRIEARVRQWVRRSRDVTRDVTNSASVTRPVRRASLPIAYPDLTAAMNTADFLAAQAESLELDLVQVRELGALRFVAPLDARLTHARAALSEHRAMDNSGELPREPEGLQAEIERRRPKLEELAAAWEGAQARETAEPPRPKSTPIEAEPAPTERLSALLEDLRTARSTGDWRAVPALDRQVSQARRSLDGSNPDLVELDQNVGELAAEILRRDARIRELTARMNNLNSELTP